MERASTIQSVHENIKSVRGQLKKVYKTLKTLENWRKAILLVCVVALGVDPLFLFIPVIDSPNFCFTFDKKLAAVVSAIRTFIDTFYVIHIIFNFITEFIAPRSQVSLRGELIVHSKAIRKRLFFFQFIVDICSVIPIPQVCVHFLLSVLHHKICFLPWLEQTNITWCSFGFEDYWLRLRTSWY